jgi:pSer/pThr/pTyr-binding forkhead associated (FHA) protein
VRSLDQIVTICPIATMAARLFCKTGDLTGSTFAIATEAQIGKSTTNDIRLSAEGVMDSHARIYLDESTGAYVVEALGGAAVRVDDMDVRTSFRLEQLNVITLGGRHDFVFQVMDSNWTTPNGPGGAAMEGEEEGGLQTRIGGDFHPLPGVLAGAKPTERPATGAPTQEDPALLTRRAGEFIPVLPTFEAARDTPDIVDDPALRTRHAGDTPGLPDFQSAPEPPKPVEEPSTRLGIFLLSVVGLDGTSREYALVEGENVIGRSPDCGLHVDDSSLSRRHAVVNIQSAGVTIRDLGSKNGTFVDEERIASDVSLTLSSSIRLGHAIEANLLSR